MSENNIKLIINSTNDRGFSQVSLMIATSLDEYKDCGALFLSEKELALISDALRSGIRDASNTSFSIDDKTLATEY